MTEGQMLRSEVYQLFDKWDIDKNPQMEMLKPTYNEYACHLCWLLGRDEFFADSPERGTCNGRDMTDAEWQLCASLVGPNGYTVYKMLKARRE